MQFEPIIVTAVTDPKDSDINEPRVTDAKTDLSSQNKQRSWKLLNLSHRNVFRNESWNRSWH